MTIVVWVPTSPSLRAAKAICCSPAPSPRKPVVRAVASHVVTTTGGALSIVLVTVPVPEHVGHGVGVLARWLGRGRSHPPATTARIARARRCTAQAYTTAFASVQKMAAKLALPCDPAEPG